ncbi:uncharacterized protein LOC118200280 [Stegodyphus dumicola]|uniref:uncharacterized protein LOC118200280 n=1 Tax=Stegodyphus dumicola TaxID=202533 RepID=UPI0015AB019B|nr:uncharacterized protein LOC118200280 [Stegodyphus dumicola]
MSKSRVAPLKKLTLPRLELMAAVIGARIEKYLGEVFNDLIDKFLYWTDSLIVLFWIKGSAKQWKQFVGNRVVEVQEKSDPRSWNHCSGRENSADLVSRGVPAQCLLEGDRWWCGPYWLKRKDNFFPKHPLRETPLEVVETERKGCVVHTSVIKNFVIDELLHKYSSWTKLLRVIAWCLRFIANVKRSSITRTKSNFLQTGELAVAHSWVIKSVQMQEFSEEIDHLKKRKLVSPRSKLNMLNPFLDDEGILRVGGRLRNASIAQNVKYPVILPKSHYITELIIRYYHYKYLHGGAQMLHSEIKQRYWIINARATIRKIIRKCVTCCRHRSELSYQAMGDLPASRVNPARAFSKCGVDFSGSFPS